MASQKGAEQLLEIQKISEQSLDSQKASLTTTRIENREERLYLEIKYAV